MKMHEKVLKAIEKWNAENPVGTTVSVLGDLGERWLTKTRSEAWGLGHADKPHTAVVKIEGKAGGWQLERLTVVSAQTEQTTPSSSEARSEVSEPAPDVWQQKRVAVINEVRAELANQLGKWRDVCELFTTWTGVASVAIGKASEHALQVRTIVSLRSTYLVDELLVAYRSELVILAAVACAAWECSVHGSNATSSDANGNKVLGSVAQRLNRQSEAARTRASKLDPLLQLGGLQYFIGEVSVRAVHATDESGTYDEMYREALELLACAAINATIFLDFGTWTWHTGKATAS